MPQTNHTPAEISRTGREIHNRDLRPKVEPANVGRSIAIDIRNGGYEIDTDDEELLELAAVGSVRILTADGHTFVLEGADDFDNEVKLLGKSKKFTRFMKERSKEAGKTSSADYRRSLD